jgi:hypothetical protein
MAELLIVIALIVLLLDWRFRRSTCSAAGGASKARPTRFPRRWAVLAPRRSDCRRPPAFCSHRPAQPAPKAIAIVQQVEHDTVQGVDVWLDIVDENDFLRCRPASACR